jgi:hypothetical protein
MLAKEIDKSNRCFAAMPKYGKRIRVHSSIVESASPQLRLQGTWAVFLLETSSCRTDMLLRMFLMVLLKGTDNNNNIMITIIYDNNIIMTIQQSLLQLQSRSE